MSAFDASNWLDMMSDTITIDAWVSESISGVPTYAGAPATYSCYIGMKNHRIVDHLGREIMARGKVFVGSAVVASVKDKITLPAEYVPRTPPILAVNIANDELGNHHTVIEIG